MLPENSPSTFSLFEGAGFYLPPDDQVVTPAIDFEKGGVDLSDASQGLELKTWRVWAETNVVKLQSEDGSPIVLFEEPGVTDLALAFDQNMRWSLAYLRYGRLTLRWYDSTVSNHVVTDFGPGRCPRMCLDDKRVGNLGNSDVVFAYLRDNGLYYRQQRDRFLIEYTLKTDLYPGTRMRSIGMNRNLRLQFELTE